MPGVSRFFGEPVATDKPTDAPPRTASIRTAEAVARAFFRTGSDPASLKRDIRRWLTGVVWSALLIPAIFYLRFGEVGPLGWGVTVFFSVYCLLSAVGLYFLARPEYHTPVVPRNGWPDRLGAWWLMTCAFGPFFGWLLTSAVPLTEGNWRWLYLGRVVLSVGLPVFTALPLLRYVRGRGAPVMLALLLGVTALPVWSGWATLQDLRAGPANFRMLHTGNRLRKPEPQR
jgi:hypothetical protein